MKLLELILAVNNKVLPLEWMRLQKILMVEQISMQVAFIMQQQQTSFSASSFIDLAKNTYFLQLPPDLYEQYQISPSIFCPSIHLKDSSFWSNNHAFFSIIEFGSKKASFYDLSKPQRIILKDIDTYEVFSQMAVKAVIEACKNTCNYGIYVLLNTFLLTFAVQNTFFNQQAILQKDYTSQKDGNYLRFVVKLAYNYYQSKQGLNILKNEQSIHQNHKFSILNNPKVIQSTVHRLSAHELRMILQQPITILQDISVIPKQLTLSSKTTISFIPSCHLGDRLRSHLSKIDYFLAVSQNDLNALQSINIQRIMSESQLGNQSCSNCSKPRQKYDIFTTKCIKHSYKLCAVCTRVTRGKECPECAERKTEEQPSVKEKSEENLPLTTTALNGTEASNQQVRIKNAELKKLMEDVQRSRQEREVFSRRANELELQKASKELEIKNLEIEKFKVKQRCDQDLRTAQRDHAKQLADLRKNFQIQSSKLAEKLEGESRARQDVLAKENEQLRRRLLLQEQELKRVADLEMTLLKSGFENERQKLMLEMQNEKSKDLVRSDARQKQARQQAQSQLRNLERKHQSQLRELRERGDREKQLLVASFTSEKGLIVSRLQKQKAQLREKLDSERALLVQTYEREKEEYRGSYADEKVGLEQTMEAKNQEFASALSTLNQENGRLRQAGEEKEAERLKAKAEYERAISERDQQIAKVTAQKNALSKYIESHDHSLDHYQKEIVDFDRYIEKANANIVDQFKSLDDTYDAPTPEKMRMTHLLIKQYREVAASTKHPQLLRIMGEKQAVVSNYVGTEMIESEKALQDLDVRDLYHVQSERGRAFRRLLQKITLFRSLDNQNVNDNIDMYFQPKLLQKLKGLLAECARKIASCNNDMSEFELIKEIDDYCGIREFLAKEFAEHTPACEEEYKAIEENVRLAFERFAKTYGEIKQNRPAEKLEEYLGKAEQLKRFMQVVDHGKAYQKYTRWLEDALGVKVEEVKGALLEILNQNKKSLKGRLDGLMVTRVYFDCYLYQKIFKKLKVFDDILSREENSYYNFNFSELYSKMVNFLKILKDEKISLCDVLITEERIATQDLERQFSSIAFDESVRIRYIYKLRNTLQARNATLSRLNGNTLIADKHLAQFEAYFAEASHLSTMKTIDQLPEIQEQMRLLAAKMAVIVDYLELRFKQCYGNSTELKEIDETNRSIKHFYQFQLFMQKNFQLEHGELKRRIDPLKYSFLPQPEDGNECVFAALLKLNIRNQDILNEVLSTPEEALREEHFEYYTNMVSFLPRVEGNKVQAKLQRAVMESVGQLETKEWLEGEVNSQTERRLMFFLNKLQNKEIAYYREVVTIHKNKVLDERQRIINSEKRKLKEDDFENLGLFLKECQKNEASNSKFLKLYVNILEDYMNYSYDNIANDIDKKSRFLAGLYNLTLAGSARSVRDIFKSKEHKIYFCRPELSSLKASIAAIERFEGDSDVDLGKATEGLVNAIRLYSIFKANEARSLLEDKERQKLGQEIEAISEGVTGNYLNLCRHLEHERIFEEKCNRKKLFVELIKIEVYGRVMKRWQEYWPQHEYYSHRGKYEQIVEKVNARIERVYEQVRQFRFYKDELKLQYDNNHFLFEHLKKVQRLVEVFKDIKYRLFKFEDYLKAGYLEALRLTAISHKDLVSIIEMSWSKEYAVLKKDIAELFTSPQLDIVLKYKMILHQKEIVKNENLLCFNEIIKEEYDFKRIVIEELMALDAKVERYLQALEKEYESFLLSEKKLEEKKKHFIEAEKARISQKYERLMADVQNSFHEIKEEAVREQKIEAEINTLTNQARSEEEQLLKQEASKMEAFRGRFGHKCDNIITKFFDSFLIVKKVESNFDAEIEEVCKKVSARVQAEMDKFDKGLKNIFISYAKKSKNSDMILGMGALNLFKQINEEQFQLNTQAMNDIHQIISKCPQTADNAPLAQSLAAAFQQYNTELQRVEKEYYESKSENRVLQLIKETKSQARELPPSVVIARIFAVYAIYRSIDARQEEISFDGNPHIAQVVAILLLVDAQKGQRAELGNRLIEVKTGEGKSRVLAGLNCYLALCGFDVYCGCYSSYLSQRDEEEFHALFVRFGVDKMISYGPFSEHCESVFNEGSRFSFKEVTKKVLLSEQLSAGQLDYLERLNRLLKRENRVNRILVIDEVDVFFDEHYFGQIYAPGIAIEAGEVKRMVRFIWDNHSDKRLSRLALQSEEYRALTAAFPQLAELLKNQVESMVHAVNNYNVHPYEIRNNEIQYVDNDSVNSKLNFGYSTAFASCYEYDRGKISEANYNKNINISLIVGQFSYAELPKYFDHIMGVSGTVEAMSDFRKRIMRDDYRIADIYALPSIYGDSHRQIVGFHSCAREDYLAYLLARIHEVRRSQRPILVFFETEEQLNLVSSSPEFNQFTSSIYKITEKMPPEMRNPLINYAGTRNRITLISSAFSRGTDFTVYDSDLNERGGMHVIQTYLSKNESDFIQILGRTGRQGKNGSFEVAVTLDDLRKNDIAEVADKDLFAALRESWKAHDLRHGKELSKAIESARQLHEGTFEVVGSMARENSKLVGAVMKLNYNEIKGETIKTVIAIDGTGSMGAALNAVLSILNDTISRTDEIISMRMPHVSFEHKIMIYRNYNTNLEKVLEQSNFSKDPAYLRAFMTSIKPEGGLGNEAHEVLFYDIGKQLDYEKIDQIIIIGDAPANTYEEMLKHRKKFRGDAYWDARFPLLPSMQEYSSVVKERGIPVHSFYILRRKQQEESIKWDRNVKTYFEELSQQSEGAFEQLNIRDKEKAKDQLTDFISERVLELIGGRDLIDLYTQMFSKRYV